MIERLKETGGWAFGFKVTGKVSAEDIKAFEPQLEFAIAERKRRPIGLLADVTEMDLLRYLANDDSTDVILMYLETLVNGRAFIELAREITGVGVKPSSRWMIVCTPLAARTSSAVRWAGPETACVSLPM